MKGAALGVMLSLAALLAAPGARADDPKDAPSASKSEEASRRFKSGVAFYKDHDFTAALVEFKAAYELVPNYNVLYNLGQTARELKDYAAALDAYERYLREGGAKIAPARRKEVAAAVDELRTKVGRLKIAINVDGAQVTIDDVPVGTSPLAAPVTVNIGRRKLSASSSGYVPAQRVVDVAGTGDTDVTLELTKLVTTPPPGTPPPPAPLAFPIYTWAAAGATGATAIVTVVLGALAVSAHGSLTTALGHFPGDASAIASARSRTKTFANATDAFIGITAAGAVATAALFVFGPRASSPSKPAAAVGVSPWGVVVLGSF